MPSLKDPLACLSSWDRRSNGLRARDQTMHISKLQKVFGVGLFGLLINLAILGLLVLLDRMAHHVALSSKPWPLRLVGCFLIGVWICWHSWCVKTISSWWRHDKLCTTGPYRFVRHPMYSGATLLALLGISLILNSWIILPLPLFAYAVNSMLVGQEEKMMDAVFGEEYQRYAARTGRLFPRFIK
jgi:protein-S-isoprenylcysteine O-methyltransferase Ste14